MTYRHLPLQSMLKLLTEKQKAELKPLEFNEQRKAAIKFLKKNGLKTVGDALAALREKREID